MSQKTLEASGVLYDERRNFYLSPSVTSELWTTVAPFTTIVSSRGITTGLQDPLFKQFEHRSSFVKQQFQVDTALTIAKGSTGTVSGSITVKASTVYGLPSVAPAYEATDADFDDSVLGLECEIWDSTLTTKRGVVVIYAASAADTITVKNVGDTAITTVADDYFIVVGNAHGEGSEAPDAWADELEIKWGSTQIFKTAVNVTGSLYHAALKGYSNELARLRDEKQKEHKMQKEKAFLFGDSIIGIGESGSFADTGVTDANGNKIRTTMGLVTALESYGTTSGDEQNSFAINSATYTYSDFVDDMEKVFFFVPEMGYKYAMCGAGALSYWSKLDGATGFAGKSGWTVNLGPETASEMGFNYRTLTTPHGQLRLVYAPALRGHRKNQMVVISDENLKYMQYRPSMFQANIKTDNAYDGYKDQYFSDEGVGFTLLESHKLFTID